MIVTTLMRYFTPEEVDAARSRTLAGPWEARAWSSHAKTTVGCMADGQFEPLAECSGYGRPSADAEAIAAMIVAALNHSLEIVRCEP